MNSKLKELYPASFLWRVLLYNSLIAVCLILIRALVLGRFGLNSIVINLIYSHFIGWSLALPLQFIAKQYAYLGILKKSIIVFIAMLIFGAIGSLTAYLLVNMLFTPDIEIVQWWQLLLLNLVLAFFFGLLALFYFSLRYKLELTISALKEKEIEQEHLKRLNKSVELEALRAKIDPHFLFNTLNSIAGLIRIDPEQAERMIEKLSALFRYSLRSGDRETVTLEDEIYIIRSYLEIEKLRFAERLSFKINISENCKSFLIPPLLLQPLIENSIKHGISKMKSGGKVNLSAKQVNNKLQIKIEDNGPGLEDPSLEEGFGLMSVRERLFLLYHDNHSFDLENQDGLQIIIEIPIVQENQNGL